MAFERLRSRLGASARAVGADLRKFPLRRSLWIVGLLAVAGSLGLVFEAAIRARLGPLPDRVPTMLYTRPVAWGEDPGERGRFAPVPIGPIRDGLEEYRIPVALADLPERLIDAVLAVEDQRFFDHHGLDLKRIAGAAVANLRAGAVTQGGSTITQQLAKNLFLTARRSPVRKAREAVMALVLEDRYDKAAILEAYLNEIYLGQDGPRAIHGVGAATRYYFGKDVDDLTHGEAALLAGMIRAPNRYHPQRHPADARARRDLVLRLMVEQDRLSKGRAERAMNERLRVRLRSMSVVDGRWFHDFAVDGLDARARRLPARGAAVYTTLDAALQRAAERAVRDGLAGLPSRGAEAALVALDPRTGDVLALVGGRDYGASQFNRAVRARRQPGSAFKPIVALAALGRQGRSDPAYTLASVIPDEPLSVATPAGRWEPENYDRDFRGPVTFREALEQSLNVPFARIGMEVGPGRIAEVGRALGIESRLHEVPSLALGSSEVTPLELTRAYGVFATGGRLAALRTQLGATRLGDRDAGGELAPALRQVADPAEVYLVTSALEGVVSRGTGRALSRFSAGRGRYGGLAGKSGTSNDWRDAWFVAFTPSLVVGVWVGHDDGTSLRLPGARAALPIAERFLREAFRRQAPEPFPVPDGIEVARVARDGVDGWGWSCAEAEEVFLEGTAPEEQCRSWNGPGWWTRVIQELRDDGWDRDDLEDLLNDRAEELMERLVEQLNRRARRLLRSR